jgi:DNA-binding transcriptional regulator GbsR (MarR family)
MNIEKEREEIIEMFGVHFSKLYNIPPLAARILGTLIVDGCKSGLTFESLVEKMSASKSSISTNLNLLHKMEKVSYFTIAGDRKKYFKPADLSDRLSSYLKLIDSEMVIIDKMVDYREKTAACPEEKCNLENVKAYRTHVIEVNKLFTKTINEFKIIESNNKLINKQSQ